MLGASLVVLVVLQVSAQYALNVWNRYIFDAIEKRDAVGVTTLSALFVPLVIGIVSVGVAASLSWNAAAASPNW